MRLDFGDNSVFSRSDKPFMALLVGQITAIRVNQADVLNVMRKQLLMLSGIKTNKIPTPNIVSQQVRIPRGYFIMFPTTEEKIWKKV